MPLLLAVVTIVVIKNTYQLRIERFEHSLDFFILLSVQDILHLFNTFVQLIIIVGHDNDVKGFEILENIFLFLVSASATDCYSAATAFLDDFLGFSLWADNLADVVGF